MAKSRNCGEEITYVADNNAICNHPSLIVTPSSTTNTTNNNQTAVDDGDDDEDDKKSPTITTEIDPLLKTTILHVQFNGGATSTTTGPNTKYYSDKVTSPTRSVDSSSTSTSSSDSSTTLDLSEARPPDGGWGWVVVAASFVVNLIADGITFSFGVIFVEFLKYFGQNRGTTAWVGSLFMAMPLLSGPIASFLTDRYGCRSVTICGSVLASIGFIISSQANSMTVLYLTFGLVSGFGLSLCYVASVVIVAYYFDRRRSFATGLAVCGSGIGTFIFAPFIQYLLNEYGWRGTTLILAGLFLNLAVCGCLMRDLPWTSHKLRERKRRKRHLSSHHTSDVIVHAPPPCPPPPNVEQQRMCASLVSLPTFVRNGEKVPTEVYELNRNLYDIMRNNNNNDTHVAVQCCKKAPPQKAAYLRDLRIHRVSVTYRGAMLNINRYRLRASSCPDIYRNSMTTIAKEKVDWWYSGLVDFRDLLIDMFDFTHFFDPKFCMFAVSNFLLYTWYDVPYVYLTDNAMSMGHSEADASMLISIIGIVNMVGEIIMGWLGDRHWADAGTIYAACMVLCGAVIGAVPLLHTTYWTLCVLSAAFGFFIAANYSLTCIILVELITLDRFTNAYGLLLLVQGVANLIGPPLGGWLYDVTTNYKLSFYLAGVFISMSGLLLMVLPIANWLKNTFFSNHNTNNTNDSSQV